MTRSKYKGRIRFGLQPGFRVGNYRLRRRLGSGLTAEAYLAEEVMTGAQRVVKIFANYDLRDQIVRQRDFAHYAWVLERMSATGTRLLPLYHHMGHAFLPDSGRKAYQDNGCLIGNYYIVQEYIEGTRLSPTACQSLPRRMVQAFVIKVMETHKAAGLALGDIDPENLILTAGTPEVRMVDCDYGSDNVPNEDFDSDVQSLIDVFGVRVKGMIASFKSARTKRRKSSPPRPSYTPSKGHSQRRILERKAEVANSLVSPQPQEERE